MKNLPPYSILILTLTATVAIAIPTPAQTTLPDSVRQTVLHQAVEDNNLLLSELQITGSNPVTWSDGCLGLHQPNQPCTTALVDGWQVLVNSNSDRWLYHATESRALLANGQAINDWMWSDQWLVNSGQTQDNPILPTRSEANIWIFEDAPSRRWFDPPTTYGFRYTMSGNSLFTEILDFPIGIDDDNAFTISVNDKVLGAFSPGQNVNFVSLLGQGVSEFNLTDINPYVDAGDPTAFPLKLAFDTATADFEMKAIPAPAAVPEKNATLGLILLGVMGVYSYLKSHFRKL